MDDVHGKEVALQCVTVKIPGQKPRGSKSIITNSALTSSMNLNWKSAGSGLIEGIGGLGLAKDRKVTEKVLLTAFDTLREPGKSAMTKFAYDDDFNLFNILVIYSFAINV